MNWKVLVSGLLVVVPLLVVLAIGFTNDPRRVDSPLVGKPAPEVSLAPMDGGDPVTLSSLRGTPTVVNFWATWCIPCQAEHETLLALANAFQGRVRFLGVVYQDEPAKIRAWLARFGSGYPTLVDDGSKAALAFGVYGVPETFLIDADGVIRGKITGPVNGDDVYARLQELLAG